MGICLGPGGMCAVGSRTKGCEGGLVLDVWRDVKWLVEVEDRVC